MFLMKCLSTCCCLGLSCVLGCGPVPTEPDDGAGSGDRVYRNEAWGFQLTIPSSTANWSLNVQTHLLWVDANGLPKVQVRLWKPPEDGAEFRPMLLLEPRALTQKAPLDTLANALEREFREIFKGYRPMGERQAVRVASEDGIEWIFSTYPVREFGDHFLAERFIATVVVHGRQLYVVLGNGTRWDFPVQGFRDIVSNLVFLK